MNFEATTENKNSYAIRACVRRLRGFVYGKPVVLVRCDRTDMKDNERGAKLAEKLASYLSSLSDEEVLPLLKSESIPKL